MRIPTTQGLQRPHPTNHLRNVKLHRIHTIPPTQIEQHLKQTFVSLEIWVSDPGTGPLDSFRNSMLLRGICVRNSDMDPDREKMWDAHSKTQFKMMLASCLDSHTFGIISEYVSDLLGTPTHSPFPCGAAPKVLTIFAHFLK